MNTTQLEGLSSTGQRANDVYVPKYGMCVCDTFLFKICVQNDRSKAFQGFSLLLNLSEAFETLVKRVTHGRLVENGHLWLGMYTVFCNFRQLIAIVLFYIEI